MTPERSLELFTKAYAAHGMDPHAIRCLWSMRVLDSWRALARASREWHMGEGSDLKVDVCIVLDLHGDEKFRAEPGTSPDAARYAAAVHVGTTEPRCLEGV